MPKAPPSPLPSFAREKMNLVWIAIAFVIALLLVWKLAS